MSQQKGKTIARVEGRERIHLYGNHCDAHNKSVAKARNEIGTDKYRQLVKFLEGDANRVSRTNL